MPRGRIPQSKSTAPVAREEGFILVAVLLLIALATVLIVTTSGVARIEGKAVANSMREEKARQNALFGLELALSQIQKEAGPDQRVTATAEILNTNSAEPSPVNNPFWTGVWKTYNPDWEKDSARSPWNRPQPHDILMAGQSTTPLRPWSTNPSNVSWMVSQPPDAQVDPVNWKPSETNSVLLASNWGTNTLANTVFAPLVMVTNVVKAGAATVTNIGSYAYWVSDEGVKAKISLCETSATTMTASSPGMLVSKLLHFTAPAAPSVAQLLTNYGINGVPDLRGNTNMSKLVTLNGLRFVTNGIPAFSNNLLSADLTVHGYGVLCDVRRGGLKQDLTAAFESTYTQPDGYTTLLYRSGVQDGSTNSDDALMAWRSSTMSLPVNLGKETRLTNVMGQGSQIDGMRWQSLYNYYNLYKARWPSSPSVGPARLAPIGLGAPNLSITNSIAARLPTWFPERSDAAATVLSSTALIPSVISQSLIVQLGSVQDPSTGIFRLQAIYYPLLVLYNPYSVFLDIGGINGSSFTLSKNLGTTNLRFSSITCGTGANQTTNLWPVDTNGLMTLVQTPSQTGVPAVTSSRTFSMSITNPIGTRLAPGEIRAYGLRGRNIVNTPSDLTAAAWFETRTSRQLRSVSDLIVGDGFGGYAATLPWPGTNNPTAPVNAVVNPASISYTFMNFTPTPYWAGTVSTVDSWPRPVGSISVRDAPGWLPGYGAGNFSTLTLSTNINSLMLGSGGGPHTVASITERLKGTLPGSQFRSFFGYTNVVPVFMGNSMYFNAHRSGIGVKASSVCPVTETSVIITNEPSVQMIPNVVVPGATTLSWGTLPVGDAPPFGGSHDANNVVKVLRGVPFAPMTSLGQFMHAEEFYDRGLNNNTNILFPRSIPAMSIGGSFCCPETGPYFTSIHFNGNAPSGTNTARQWILYADNSFLANDALFDTYFFSTVPPSGGFSWGSGLQGYGPYSSVLTPDFLAGRESLPNPRHVFYFKNGTNPSISDLQDESKAAANLLVDGAFNVNSTSVVAWKALLTSLNGSSMTVRNVVKGQIENRINLTNPILRFWDVCSSSPNIPWDGTRCLTDLQAETLAREIVRQVKARGPFLSISDFLNRRIPQVNTSWNTNHIMGALQSAIENTATNGSIADVNNIIHNPNVSVRTSPGLMIAWACEQSTLIPYTNPPLPFVDKIVTNSAVGIPGYLMQQDLLQAFAPVMTARSDTFLIRFYGDSRGKPSGLFSSSPVEARVWGEAVVQRLPEYYDQEDPALSSSGVIPGMSRPLGDATPPIGRNGPTLGPVNMTFGRRFKIVSLRWLSPEEISPSVSAAGSKTL